MSSEEEKRHAGTIDEARAEVRPRVRKEATRESWLRGGAAKDEAGGCNLVERRLTDQHRSRSTPSDSREGIHMPNRRSAMVVGELREGAAAALSMAAIP